MAEHEGSDSPFEIIKGIRSLGFSDRDLVFDTILINKIFPNAFQYADLRDMEYDLLLELTEAAKDTAKE